ncbi:MAG: LytTR family DNA-binding domain-containing protein [Flavobacteriales bacterium]
MLRVLLIEDEQPAMERLRRLVVDFDSGISIVAELGSIKESMNWLMTHPEPDLIIADIQLSDGLSHSIFESHPTQCPIIFVTAYDHYITKAFEFNSIDYVLKPVKTERLHMALNKYLKVRSHFVGNLSGLQEALRVGKAHPIDRLLAKKGTELKSLNVEDIAWFYTEHKVSFAIAKDQSRYIVEHTLSELEGRLDQAKFFRVNRKYLCSIDAIQSAVAVGKGRLSLKLHPPVMESVEVSQEKASGFKDWLGS